MKNPKPQRHSALFDPEVLAKICVKIKAEGFIPKTDLLAEFGPEDVTRAIAIIYRDYRLVREVRRPWKDDVEVVGYEWGDIRFNKAQANKVPEEYGFILDMASAPRVKYTDYEHVVLKCRWTNWVIAALPGYDAKGESLQLFERDGEGNVLLPAYCCRAMMLKTLPLIGKEQSAGYRIAFEAVRIENPNVKSDKILPKVDERAHKGLGTTRVESLPPGTEFELRALVPTSVISVSDYVRAVELAGRFVHLSPARSAGYGDFEVIK